MPSGVPGRVRSSDPEQAEAVELEDRRGTAVEMRSMLRASCDEAATLEPAAAANVEKLERRSNRQFFFAVDGILRFSANLELRYFIPCRDVGALGAQAQRILVPWQVPDSDTCRQRSMIRNTTSGEQRWETGMLVGNGRVLVKPAFHLVLDQCSKGWHFGVWLFFTERQD